MFIHSILQDLASILLIHEINKILFFKFYFDTEDVLTRVFGFSIVDVKIG
jgi:hypothetical protein